MLSSKDAGYKLRFSLLFLLPRKIELFFLFQITMKLGFKEKCVAFILQMLLLMELIIGKFHIYSLLFQQYFYSQLGKILFHILSTENVDYVIQGIRCLSFVTQTIRMFMHSFLVKINPQCCVT